MMLSTSPLPVHHHSDEESGRPAWHVVWDSYPSHLLRKVLGIADLPILSSSPRNGSGTARNGDMRLVD